MSRTFEQSYDRLDPVDPTDALACTLLIHAACFAPGEPLPRWLLIQTRALPEDDAEQALAAEDALTRLIDLGLLETDAAGSLRMHRLLVAFVQAVLGNEAAQAVVEGTMLRVADDLNARRNPRLVLTIQPHLRLLTQAAQPRADARAAGLGNAMGVHLWLLGSYPEAQRYLDQALAIRRRVLGTDHPDTAESLHHLGRVLHTQGQDTEARHALEQALAIYEQAVGSGHPSTQRIRASLTALLEQHSR